MRGRLPDQIGEGSLKRHVLDPRGRFPQNFTLHSLRHLRPWLLLHLLCRFLPGEKENASIEITRRHHVRNEVRAPIRDANRKRNVRRWTLLLSTQDFKRCREGPVPTVKPHPSNKYLQYNTSLFYSPLISLSSLIILMDNRE